MMLASALLAASIGVADVYRFHAHVVVPQVFDNTTSQGYRKNRHHCIKGEMAVVYLPDPESEDGWARPRIEFLWLTNFTHKVNGKRVGYKTVTVNNDGEEFMGPMTRVNAIGNNKTDKFTTADVQFYMDAEPDYSRGEDDEDNSLLVTCSAHGTTALVASGCSAYRVIRRLTGKLAGSLGCGCKAYGHTSPTRIFGPYGPTDKVDDVAKVHGTWNARWERRTSWK